MEHPYQKVTDGTLCTWEINPAGTMQDLRDAVELMSQSFEAKTTFFDFLNRPSVKAVMVKS